MIKSIDHIVLTTRDLDKCVHMIAINFQYCYRHPIFYGDPPQNNAVLLHTADPFPAWCRGQPHLGRDLGQRERGVPRD